MSMTLHNTLHKNPGVTRARRIHAMTFQFVYTNLPPLKWRHSVIISQWSRSKRSIGTKKRKILENNYWTLKKWTKYCELFSFGSRSAILSNRNHETIFDQQIGGVSVAPACEKLHNMAGRQRKHYRFRRIPFKTCPRSLQFDVRKAYEIKNHEYDKEHSDTWILLQDSR